MQKMKNAPSPRQKRYNSRTATTPATPFASGLPARPPNHPHSAPSTDRPHPNRHQGDRLQKVLARAGLGSRRHCEELILQARVEVDRQVITQLGTRVDPFRQEIRVDGEPIKLSRPMYFIVNKPPGVVCTHRDPAGRTRVIDLLPSMKERLFTVGRLDRMSEGLLLVTNDGPLANLLAHPRYGVAKTYQVQVAGKPEPEALEKLRQGVRLAEGMARCASVRFLRHHKNSTLLELVLTEGKNREIRRVLAKVGHKVLWLKRVALGPVRLGHLAPGEFRRLREDELQQLRALVRHRAKRQSVQSAEPLHTAETSQKGEVGDATEQARSSKLPRVADTAGHAPPRPAAALRRETS